MPRMVDDLLLLARQNHPDRQTQFTNPLVNLGDVVLEQAQRSTAAANAIDTGRVAAGQVRCNPDHLVQVGRNLPATHSVRPRRSPHSRSENKAQPSCSASTTTSPQPTGNSSSNGWAAPTKLDHATTAAPASPSSPELIKRDDGEITVGDGPGLGRPRFTVTLPNARARRRDLDDIADPAITPRA